ncbi:MAG TPA: YigZ family protein [Patescibacteria group bacterium]|nr:YigZ family protein [Patescibacteria group bacterium]
MPTNLIPAEETRIEMRVENSRFIATVAPAFSVDEAKRFIQRIKAEFSDASHNVPAFVIGHGPSTIAHCTDDGEPSGTAGRPALAVLRGSGLGDVVVVVTRYFGGTKLGTGGLVRAYGAAVREVLFELTRAEKVPTQVVTVAIPYNLYEQTRQIVAAHAGAVLDELFAADVTLTIQFRATRFPEFQEALQELTHGAVEATLVESNPDTIMPLEK